MDFKYIAGIVVILIGVAFQFLWGASGWGDFFGSLCVLLAPLFISPNSSYSADLFFATNYTSSDEKKTLTVAKPYSEIMAAIKECRSSNHEMYKAGNKGVLKLITVMRIVGVCLAIFMCICCIVDNPQLGAILTDLVFVPYFIFKCLFDWPVDIYCPSETDHMINEDVVIPIDKENPDNPYFGFQYKIDLARNAGHAVVKEVSPLFTLKKEIPHLLCAQLQVTKNWVRCTEYPYAYFVMVYPEDRYGFVRSLEDKTISFIKENHYKFKTEVKKDDGNVILIVMLSAKAKPAYHTGKKTCRQLSNIIMEMLKTASTEE